MSVLVLVLILGLRGTGEEGTPAPLACSAAAEWAAVVGAHVSRYPDMEVADLYKLLHQGGMGSEHAVPSPAAARAWMDDELATLGDGPVEPLLDTIAPGAAHVRIHLRPFMARGGDVEALLSAFVDTANGHTGSEETLTCALETALTLARDGQLPWDEDRISSYFGDMAAQGYPAVHHSQGFESIYRPAYRVVAGELSARVLESLR